MKIEQHQNGFALVNLPFELKDLFKKTFSTAKWDGIQKVWTVGVRSEKKLAQFVNEIQADVQEINEVKEQADNQELLVNELQKIKDELAQLKAEINNQKEKSNELNSVLALLNEVKDEVKELTIEKNEIVKANENTQNEIKNAVNKIIDVKNVENAIMNIKKVFKSVKSADRDIFNQQIKIVLNELNKLEEKGLTNKFLINIVNINWNRKDKFNIYAIDLNDIFKVSKL